MDYQPGATILPPHILLFPLPIQGHVNSMLKLAELLCLHDIHVTMLTSDYCHSRLLRHGNLQSRSLLSPAAFCFKTIPDGLPEDHPRVGERVLEVMPPNVTAPLFRELMTSTNCLRSETRRPLTCIIADGLLNFAGDFALEKGIPLIYFHTISASSYWASFCTSQLIDADEIPLKGNGMDLPVTSVPGMEDFLRRRDLPSFFRADDINDPHLQYMKTGSRKNLLAQALIKNTFDDLEGSVLSHMRTHSPNIYTIGPLHAHLTTRLAAEMTSYSSSSSSSSSFWEEDRKCLTWLNSQVSKSVIYVSFGSITVMTREQHMEFWYGLVNSGQRFLWVIRPDLFTVGEDGESQIPVALEEGTRERGYVVGWAPQEEVLTHPAIGGFLTHSGWNSTLESITARVPMICWPYFADQQVNSRLVSEVWKLGLDMKDTCDRVVVEKMVRDLMEVRKDEFQQQAGQMANMAKRAVSKGGSSYCNLDRLVQDIKSMIV